MRMVFAGLVAAAAAGAAVWIAVATATPNGYPGGSYQIYILNTAEQQSTLAIAVGDRAAAAMVEHCASRVLDDPGEVVNSIRARAEHDSEAELSIVYVVGEGSAVNLGECTETPNEKDGAAKDSLVIVRDAGAAQVRHLIGEIHGLPAAQQQAMLDALALDAR